jgi:hypothetical protein
MFNGVRCLGGILGVGNGLYEYRTLPPSLDLASICLSFLSMLKSQTISMDLSETTTLSSIKGK